MQIQMRNTAIQSAFYSSLKILACLAIFALLINCGGGGGGGKSSSSAVSNAPPVADAGDNKTVNAGDIVELKAGGTDSDGTITSYGWSQLSATKVTLTAVDLYKAHFTFVAPATGKENSITLEFRLTVTDNQGATSTDTVVFTVNRVNQSPSVSLGEDKTAVGLSLVNLSGAATDSDGSIASYAWLQTLGPAVELGNADAAVASFTAPSTNANVTLEFSLTVTDNDGATATDTVAVVVTSENAPLISLTFPPATGSYRASSISAFGVAETKNAATITSITVSAGGDSVTAITDANGHWRADNIPVPVGVESFRLVAEVTDSNSLTQQASAMLSTTSQSAGQGDKWQRAKAVAAVPGEDLVYVLTGGFLTTDFNIVPVDINTGARGAPITQFGDATQGSQNTTLQHMLYDHASKRLLLTNPESTTHIPQILAVDITSGMRNVLASAERGSGENFSNPISMSWGPGDRLLVADNKLNVIFVVDVNSGDRKIIASAATPGLAVNAPLHVSSDSERNRLVVTPYVYNNHYFLAIDDWLTDPFGSVLSSNTSNPGPEISPVVQAVSMDQANDRLLVLDGQDKLFSIDLETGNRNLLAEKVTGSTAPTTLSKGMDYDAVRKLLYVVDGGSFSKGLFVVDPASGSSVLLSH